jgi:hypothetical protein
MLLRLLFMEVLGVTLKDILPFTLLLEPEVSGLECQRLSLGGTGRQRCSTLR